MKYNNDFELTPLGSLRIILPPEISVVATFLEDDVQGDDGTFWLSRINQVFEEDLDCVELGGNSCNLEIRKDITRVINEYLEEEQNECLIETIELRNLIEVWVEESKKYK